ncbi:MAG: hypothetical protein KGJ55_06710 [Gammaproteobacteria bacterium]|nr:hypothetical protein [Gammaproteobacteria bacterium]
MAAIAFLAFVAGGWTVLAKVFPGTVIHDAYRAAGAAWKKNTGYVNPFTQTDHWRPARTLYRGVTVDPAAQVDPGYTLYTTGDSARAVLVSAMGRIVWQWQMPYSKVWNRHAAVKNPRPDRLIFWTRARVFPDGDLLAIYEAAGDTPWGYGMVKLNRDSQVLWGYRQHTHHNFDIGPDGRIYALTNNFTSKIIPKFDFLARTRLDDSLVILSADGKQIDQISLTRALADGPYRRLLSAVPVFSIADPCIPTRCR